MLRYIHVFLIKKYMNQLRITLTLESSGHVTRDDILSPAMTPSASSQRFQTLDPGGPRRPVVRPERAPLPVLLRAASPRPAARGAERDGSPERRVLGQRPETAEGGVRPMSDANQPADGGRMVSSPLHCLAFFFYDHHKHHKHNLVLMNPPDD